MVTTTPSLASSGACSYSSCGSHRSFCSSGSLLTSFATTRWADFAKALWLIFVVILPFIGVLGYVIVQGDWNAPSKYQSQQAQREAFDGYVRETEDTPSSADELAKLAALKDQGVITEAEFAAQKGKLLAT